MMITAVTIDSSAWWHLDTAYETAWRNKM